MKKAAANVTILLGLIALSYGLFMNITVNNTYNLYLANQRTAIMLFGGFSFLGGIGLLAIQKISQSEEERKLERTKDMEMKDNFKSGVNEIEKMGIDASKTGLNMFVRGWNCLKTYYNKPRKLTGIDVIIAILALVLICIIAFFVIMFFGFK